MDGESVEIFHIAPQNWVAMALQMIHEQMYVTDYDEGPQGVHALYQDIAAGRPSVIRHLWLARHEYSYVGVAMIDLRPGAEGFLKPHLQLLVRPECRHHGIGRAILREVLKVDRAFYVQRTASAARLYDHFDLPSHPLAYT
jgi:GNAT superfamily N-acetyltransferase